MKDVGYEVVSLDAQNQADTADQPDRRRDQPEAGGDDPRRRRFRRDQARHREGARRRHPGDDLRPADPSTPSDLTSVAGTVEIGHVAGGGGRRGCSPRSTARPRARCCRSSATRPTPIPSTSRRASRRRWRQPRRHRSSPARDAVGSRPTPATSLQDQLLTNPDIDLIFIHAAHLPSPVAAVLESAGKKPGEIMHGRRRTARPVGLDLHPQGLGAGRGRAADVRSGRGLAMFVDKVVNKTGDQGRHL